MAAFDYMDGRPAVNDEIWDASEQLHLVRRWGLRHNASPFTTLGAVLVRLAGEDSWRHLTAGVSGGADGAGTCSISVVAVGPSGKGKSLSKLAADKALTIVGGKLPEPPNGQPPWWRSVSTPEGMFEYFQDKVPDPDWEPPTNADGETSKRTAPLVWRQHRHQAIGFCDEITELVAKAGRAGNWLIAALSSALLGSWGEVATKTDRRPALLQQTHLSLYTGAQDHLLGEILFGAGSTQGWSTRQLVLDAIYPPATSQPADDGAPLPALRVELPDCGECRPCTGRGPASAAHIWDEPAAVKKLIAVEATRQLAGEIDNGHANLLRRRIAKHLAVLHNQPATRPEDWEIAGLLLDHDQALRTYLEGNESLYVAERTRRDRKKAVQISQAVKTQDDATADIIDAAAQRLRVSHPEGFTATDLHHALRGDEREVLLDNGPGAGKPGQQIITALIQQGRLRWEGQTEGQPPGRRGQKYFIT